MRTDLTDWLIHFVHPVDLDNAAWSKDGDLLRWPVRFQAASAPVYAECWDDLDADYVEEKGSSFSDDSFSILLKILNDGHLRAGWALRGGKPTIYGPRPAVCFTEMPLHALLEYARNRADAGAVSTYGIALPRSELYASGARPVIYGLSGDHKEAQPGDANYIRGARCLSARCGLGLREQYRYVSTRLNGPKVIDWTHEREWRWTRNFEDETWDPPGLPIWLSQPTSPFTRRLVIVNSKVEAEKFVQHLKRFHDAGCNEWSITFDRAALAGTRVVAVEDLAALAKEITTVRLDDLPLHSLPAMSSRAPSAEMIEKVIAAMAAAREAARRALEDERKQLPSSAGSFGFASVVTPDAHSEVTEAPLRLGYADAHGTIGYYYVYEATRGLDDWGILHYARIGAEAAAAVLEAELSQGFYVRCRDD